MNRAGGLVITSPSPPFAYGPDQSLHESSGSSVLPERVNIATAPVASHRMSPHVEMLFVSRTGEMYVAGVCVPAPGMTTRPGFAVANGGTTLPIGAAPKRVICFAST